MKKVIVVGGGAAGMMAAISAAKRGYSVTLIEKNEKLGKKIYITGKGRCNVTNSCEVEEILNQVCTNAKFLYSAIYGFDNHKTMELFEQMQCKLKVERGNRVFPVSDHASDIILALEREMKRQGVVILLNKIVSTIVKDKENKKVTSVILKSKEEIKGDCIILATGGLSYSSTGSTGDGYRLAKECGHKIIPCTPSLVGLHTKETWCKDCMGLSLKNIELTLKQGEKVWYQNRGELLFTHKGISGPLVLSASSFYAKCKGQEPIYVYLDLKPALTIEQLDKRMLREFEENKNKQFKNSLGSLFPTKLIPIMLKLSGIEPDKKIYEINKKERKEFVHIIKSLPLTIIKSGGFEEAIITKGGVNVKEINPSTMESKKIKGLYFAGEMMDIDAYTGGFNLQLAWSTGYLAGDSVE